jgi:hypothetical protein
MKRALRVALVLGAPLIGCGDDTLAGLGEPCQSSEECKSGLLCDYGRSPHVCAPTGTLGHDLSVIVGHDAGLDLRGVD